jgi:hypothetical protein
MRRHLQLLQQLIRDSQYDVDARAVADAILMRAMARSAVAGTTFRNDVRAHQVRSFRPSRKARSFRPCNGSEADALQLRPRRRA